MTDMCGYAWMKYKPAQRRPDQRRAERRPRGEQRKFDSFSTPETFQVNVANHVVPAHNDARNSRSNDPTDDVTVFPMASDTSNSSDRPKETALKVSKMVPSTLHPFDAQQVYQSASSSIEGTANALWARLAEVTKPEYQPGSLHEGSNAVRSGMMEAHLSSGFTDLTSSPSPCKRRTIPKSSYERTFQHSS